MTSKPSDLARSCFSQGAPTGCEHPAVAAGAGGQHIGALALAGDLESSSATQPASWIAEASCSLRSRWAIVSPADERISGCVEYAGAGVQSR
jgi:hypothetical protein